MCDAQDIRFIWQLVSQFVSWDFCRYMCEQNENQISDVDVLTFLRNMIVQRTEKSITNITKHEIVAKLVMESIAVKDISRMPCIITLSESVKSICPELESAVDKLVRLLKTFLSNLNSDEERRKEELIKLRIEETVMDFSKQANRLLPSPNLLQVVESWNHHHDNVHQKQQPKNVTYSAEIFEKVLECLYLEYNKITPSEAKLIASSLYEDKMFERIFTQAGPETETEADSEQFTLSLQSSQPNDHIYSQESDCEKNPEFRFLTPTLFKTDENGNAAPKSQKTQKFIYLSDTESNDSSVRTMSVLGSQRNDPTWSSHRSNREILKPKKTIPKRIQKKKVPITSDSEDNDDDSAVEENVQDGSPTHIIPVEKPTKRRRIEKTVRLYRSPNISIDDFHQLRRPAPVVSNNIPVHQSTNIRPASKKAPQAAEKTPQAAKKTPQVVKKTPHAFRKTPLADKNAPQTSENAPQAAKNVPQAAQNAPKASKNVPKSAKNDAQAVKNSNKKQKCKQCNRAYKTVLALRRHIFLQHTSPINSTPDSDVS